MFHQFRKPSQIYKTLARNKRDKKISKAPAYQTRINDRVYYPELKTFQDAFLVLNIPDIPSKTKEVAFQVLNRTIWTNNKAFKSHMAASPTCDRCNETETMEHLLCDCEHYSEQVWQETSTMLTGALIEHTGQHVARINLTHLEIIFNKPHPSILTYLTNKKDRLLIIMLIQEIKRDILFRRMNITQRTPGPTTQIRIQAHVMSTLKKLQNQTEYQGNSENNPPLPLLQIMKRHLTVAIE
jgi:hypothetical protein